MVVVMQSGGARPHSKTQAKNVGMESRQDYGVRQCFAALGNVKRPGISFRNSGLLGHYFVIRRSRFVILIIRLYSRDSRANLLLLRLHSCSFVVKPGNDLTIRSLRRSFSLLRQSMKRYLPFVIVAAVALVTVGSGAMLYRTKRAQLLPVSENRSVSGKTGAESMHIRGNPDAPVTLEEFADFQCPPCGSFAGFAEELLKQYDSRLRIVFRNFPLAPHEHAREAALAAEAAGLQGHFWEMHDVLYREQTAWSKAPNARELFESYAGTIGLNLDQFKKDMDGEKARERVDSDHALGDSLGITLTPTLFINNHPVDPKDKNPEGVRAAIDAALAGKSQT